MFNGRTHSNPITKWQNERKTVPKLGREMSVLCNVHQLTMGTSFRSFQFHFQALVCLQISKPVSRSNWNSEVHVPTQPCRERILIWNYVVVISSGAYRISVSIVCNGTLIFDMSADFHHHAYAMSFGIFALAII